MKSPLEGITSYEVYMVYSLRSINFNCITFESLTNHLMRQFRCLLTRALQVQRLPVARHMTQRDCDGGIPKVPFLTSKRY